MNENEIKDITRQSIVRAPDDFTERLVYQIENEKTKSLPRIPPIYFGAGAMAFIMVTAFIFLEMPEVSISQRQFINKIPKRGLQIIMAVFFLFSVQFVFNLNKQIQKI